MVPFDQSKLFALMEDEGIDLLAVNSRHNIRYLTGGYYFHLHAAYLPTGVSQYLPFVGLPRGRIEDAFIIGFHGEQRVWEAENLWIRNRVGAGRETANAARVLTEVVQRFGCQGGRIGIEMSMLPADAYLILGQELPDATWVDASPLMAELRSVKTPNEIELLRGLYDRAASAIQATFAGCRPGITTLEVAEIVRLELETRGLNFLWVYTAAGPGFLRAPSRTTWDSGRILHIDAGSEQSDYVVDLCRLGCLAPPALLARELHLECLAMQDAIRARVKPGVTCASLFEATNDLVSRSTYPDYARCAVHGIGMVPSEYPIVAPGNQRVLEAGHVLSLETDILHPECGHVKIEDTVVVDQSGNEPLGQIGRELQIV